MACCVEWHRASRPRAIVGRAAAAVVVAAVLAVLAAGCASSDLTREQFADEYFNLGTGFLESDDTERAIRYLERAVTLQPDAADARYNLASAFLEAGDTQAANVHLQWLLTANPDNLRALELQAETHQRASRWGDALAVYQRLLTLQPQHLLARFNSAILLWTLGDRAQAAVQLRALLNEQPDDPEARLHLGLLIADAGDAAVGAPAEASALLRDYLEQHPDAADALLALARVERAQRRYDAALEVYAEAEQQLADDDPRRAEAAFERAEILLTAVEDPIAGLEALRTALQGGFADSDRVADLLAREDLLYRPMVLDMIANHAADDG
jgi:tetratricopeptide (TPR) repeat protein